MEIRANYGQITDNKPFLLSDYTSHTINVNVCCYIR